MATPVDPPPAAKKQFKQKFPRQISWHCTPLELEYITAVRDQLRNKDRDANFRDVFNLMRDALTAQGLFIPPNFPIDQL